MASSVSTSLTISEACYLLQLPPEIAQAYESNGLRVLYPWQSQCILNYKRNAESSNIKNLVYCAPTSGGKSLIAELFLLRAVITNQQKSIFVLPYVSMVNEKQKYMKRLLRLYNRNQQKRYRLKVRAIHGNQGGYNIYQDNIFITTIEKSNRIFNELGALMVSNVNLGKNPREVSIGCVVVDEMHSIGSTFNGYLLEILICKILMLSKTFSHLQLIAMSATISNVEELALWLNAQSFVTEYRPVPLQEMIVAGSSLYNSQGALLSQLSVNQPVNDKNVSLTLCVEALRKKQQVIMFCPTKADCSSMAASLVDLFRQYNQRESALSTSIFETNAKYTHLDRNTRSVLEKLASDRLKLKSNLQELKGYDGVLIAGVEFGVACHTANLRSDERVLIEKAFKIGTLSVLTATSTLAAGVNLPAGCVIIRSLLIGKDALGVMQYRQMSGRAGRAGQAEQGFSYLVVKNHEKEKAVQLIAESYPRVLSQLSLNMDGGNALIKALIDAIGLPLCASVADIELFLSLSLFYRQSKAAVENNIFHPNIVSNKCLSYLTTSQIANLESNGNVSLTKFGKAIISCSMDPDEAVVVYESLIKARSGLILDIALHVMYLITPLGFNSIYPDFKQLLNAYDVSMKSKEKSLARVLQSIGIDYGCLASWSIHPPTKYALENCFNEVKVSHMIEASRDGKSSLMSIDMWKNLCYIRRVWLAGIMVRIVEGASMDVVSRQYNCSISDLYSLRSQTIVMAAKVKRLTKEIGWLPLSRLIDNYKKLTLTPCESDDVRSLLELKHKGHPSLNEKAAKILVNSGITSIEDLSLKSVDSLVRVFTLAQGFEPGVLRTLRQSDQLLSKKTNDEAAKRKRDEDEPVSQTIKDGLTLWVIELIEAARNHITKTEKLTNEQAEVLVEALDRLDIEYSQNEADLFIDADSNSDNDESYSDISDLLNDEESVDSLNINGEWEAVEVDPDEDIANEDQYNDDMKSEDEYTSPKNIINVSSNEKSINHQDEGNDKDLRSPPTKISRRETNAFEIKPFNLGFSIDEVTVKSPWELNRKTQIANVDVTPAANLPYRIANVDSPVEFLNYRDQQYIFNSVSRNLFERDRSELTTTESSNEMNPYRLTAAEAVRLSSNPLNSFAVRSLESVADCKAFMNSLFLCKCICYEVVYRRIPKRSEGRSTRDYLTQWQPLISWSCPKTSSESYGGVPLSGIISPLDVDDRTLGQDPHVITGIAINFGDMHSYWINLPCPLPPLSFDQNVNNRYDTKNVSPIYLLEKSIECMELICQFVGFEKILNRTPNLKSYITGYSDDFKSNRILNKSLNSKFKVVSNGLSQVSRKWAEAYRNALSFEFESGRCLEWALVRQIMSNASINKVALHMKSKLVGLLGRNVTVQGDLQDPVVALSILEMFDVKVDKSDRELNLPPQNRINDSNSSSSLKLQVWRRACHRATAVMRAMARFESILSQNSIKGALELFRNVEMPVLYSIADMEFHGILINTSFYYNLRQDIQDRKLMIEYYCKQIIASKIPGFNCESASHVRDLNSILSKALKDEQEALKMHTPVDSENVNWSNHPIKSMLKEHRSITIMGLTQTEGLLTYMMKTKDGDRVSAFFDQFGTPTGRLIATNPSLQNSVKLFYYIPVDRWTLSDEMKRWESEGSAELESLMNRMNNGYFEKVRVINKNRSSRRSLDPSTLELVDAYRLADLVELKRTEIFIKPNQISITGSERTKWIAGVKYRQSDCPTELTQESARMSLNKLIRLKAPMTPNEKEQSELQESFLRPLRYTVDQNSSEIFSKRRYVKFREGFIAAPGYVLVAADYSQFELRVLAHFCKDSKLCAAFHGDEDVFYKIASVWLQKEIGSITSSERNLVKQICYKKIYGAGAAAIAEDLGISISEAKEKMEDFMACYPKINEFVQNVISKCEKTKYIDTLLGRRLYAHDINSDDWKKKGKAERMAVNAVCQGSSADIIKMAMVNINARINLHYSQESNGRNSCPGAAQKRNSHARLVHMIHDELLYEVRIEDVDIVTPIIEECMQMCVRLRVPLKVNVKIGSTWGNMVPYSEYVSKFGDNKSLKRPFSKRASYKNIEPFLHGGITPGITPNTVKYLPGTEAMNATETTKTPDRQIDINDNNEFIIAIATTPPGPGSFVSSQRFIESQHEMF